MRYACTKVSGARSAPVAKSPSRFVFVRASGKSHSDGPTGVGGPVTPATGQMRGAVAASLGTPCFGGSTLQVLQRFVAPPNHAQVASNRSVSVRQRTSFASPSLQRTHVLRRLVMPRSTSWRSTCMSYRSPPNPNQCALQTGLTVRVPWSEILICGPSRSNAK